MTLTLPASRNSFHPAWLLLLVPPFAGILVNGSNEAPLMSWGQLLQLVLTALWVAPLIWLRSQPVAGRTQRILKELRTLMPGFLISTLVPGLLTLQDSRDQDEWGIRVFSLGVFWMGASAFGSEFEQRTMAGLLGQPLRRGILFLEKLSTLGLLLALATGNLCFGMSLRENIQFDRVEELMIVLIPLFAFCSGPLFSLLGRGTLAGIIFTLAAPLLLWGGVLLATTTLYQWLHPDEVLGSASLDHLLAVGTPLYLVVTSVLGWRMFRDLQLLDGAGGDRGRASLNPLNGPINAALGRLFPAIGSTGRLVRKELQLQVIPWMVACLLIGLWFLWLALRYLTRDPEFHRSLNEPSTIAVFAGLLGAVIVISTGLTCVAEERELRTLEWQLTQPASLRRQWTVKLLVTMILAVGLGFLLPAGLLLTGFGVDVFLGAFGGASTLGIISGITGFIAILVPSIYGSSLARNTMMAAPAAVGVAVGLGGVIYLTAMTAMLGAEAAMADRFNAWKTADVMPGWVPSTALLENAGIGLIVLTIFLLATALLVLSGRNFRRMRIPASVMSKQLAGVVALWLLMLGVGGGIFYQLSALRFRASVVEAARERRVEAIRLIRELADSGFLTPGFYQRFGVPTHAAPEALLQGILEKEGKDAIYRIEEITRPARNSKAGQLDPRLIKRYRLWNPVPLQESPPESSDK